ncbi:hypothetical protein [Saccharibacillus sacchari]|uniref:Uncharacterized protein n=1 Tax=Saccharibacillus sacchari TaxID=456493 RepID=A0ACC6PEI7_9BACL
MNPLPEEYELISLFESEPQLMDEDIPWFYNTLTFKLQRESDILSCTISPAYQSFSIDLTINERKIYSLGFKDVKGLTIEKDKDVERLIVEMNDESAFVTLIIQTNPQIRIATTHDNSFRK